MRSPFVLVLLGAAGLHASCGHQAIGVGETIPQPRLENAAMEADEPTPLGSLDESDHPGASPELDAPTYGEEAEFEALFVIDPVAGSKRLQPESLVLDTGERWIVAYRPLRSHFRFADKRVVVRGRPYWNPSHIQSVVATHFELDSIELAPGEAPYDPQPAQLPSPPQVRTRSEVEGRLGRGLWVHCVGVLSSLQPSQEDEEVWLEATFTLEDGTEVPLRRISKNRHEFAELAGATSTILARILGVEASKVVLAPVTICAGAVDRCQMTLDNTRDL